MERMLGQPSVLQGRSGDAARTGPADRIAAFLEGRFRSAGNRAGAGLGTAIVELAGNLPYDVQRLAHELWDDVRRRTAPPSGLDDLHETLRRLLGEHEYAVRGDVAAPHPGAAGDAARRRSSRTAAS